MVLVFLLDLIGCGLIIEAASTSIIGAILAVPAGLALLFVTSLVLAEKKEST